MDSSRVPRADFVSYSVEDVIVSGSSQAGHVISVDSSISLKFVPTTNSSEDGDFNSITDTLTVSDLHYFPCKEFRREWSTSLSESGAFGDSVTFSSVTHSFLGCSKDLGVPTTMLCLW